MNKLFLSFTNIRGNKKTIPKLVSGFTLIELLVVIAIIGILSSVVLASLNSARDKGTDAAIKANLKTIQTQASVFYSDNNNYGPYNQTWCSSGYAGTVFNETTIAKAVNQLGSLAGGASNTRCHVCPTGSCTDATEQSYVIIIQLKTGGTAGDSIPDTLCVDSIGNSKSFTYATGQTIDNAVDLTNNYCK